MEKVVYLVARWRRNAFVRVVQETLESIFPFVFIGTIAKVVQISFFSKKGYFNEIFSISSWLPHFGAYTYAFQNLSMMTLGVVAILAAYQAARVRARQRQADHSMAGLTSIVSFLLVSAQYIKAPFFHVDLNVFGYDRLIVGLLVGFAVGNIFAWCGRHFPEDTRDGFTDAFFSSFKPILIAIVLAFLLNKLGIWIGTLISEKQFHDILIQLSQSNSMLATFCYSLLTILSQWCGLNIEAGKVTPNTGNLNYVFQHSIQHTMPHPFDGYTLYNGYAVLMGLGLTIAILLVSHNRNHQTVAKLNLIPSLFNNNQALFTGIPLVLNPLYLIPLLVIPLLNMLIAVGAIAIHLIPTSVYPIPTGTISLFVPFMATNCRWLTILVSLGIIFVDVIIFIPFVRLSERIDQQVKKLEEEIDNE